MRKLIFLLQMLLLSFNSLGQTVSNNEYTTLPILYLNPNPQICGMGCIGLVSSMTNDNAGLTQNPALLSRNRKIAGIQINYSPFRNINRDAYIANVGLYYAIDSRNTISYSYEYFRAAEVRFIENASYLSKPTESFHSFRYAASVNPNLSAGIGVKFVKSNLAPIVRSSFNTFSFDFGIDYRRYYKLSEASDLRIDVAIAAQNFGPQISYKENLDFKNNIAENVGAGLMLTYLTRISKDLAFSIDVAYQVETIVVPTPKIYNVHSTGWTEEIGKGGNYDSISSEGYFGSFLNPKYSKEMEPLAFIHKFGTEVSMYFGKKFKISARAGRNQEFEASGGDSYYTFGAGAGIYGFRLDYSAMLLKPNMADAFSISYTRNLKSK